MSPFRSTFLAIAVVSSLAVLQAHANQRVFVASTGSDANTAANCTFANPCRSFAAAITVVDPGGEILALDAAGFGAVTVTKSVSIIGNPGFYAGIAASTGSAVTISTAGVDVVLRGLNINGIGATIGVNMTDGNSLTIENCVISNFTNVGVFVGSTATSAKVKVSDSVVRGNHDGIEVEAGTLDIYRSKLMSNTQTGMFMAATAVGSTIVGSVSDSDSSGNAFGYVAAAFDATATAKLSVTRSTASHNTASGINSQAGSGTTLVTASSNLVTNNSVGLANSGAAGTLESQGNNTVRQNGSNSSGTITPVSGL